MRLCRLGFTLFVILAGSHASAEIYYSVVVGDRTICYKRWSDYWDQTYQMCMKENAQNPQFPDYTSRDNNCTSHATSEFNRRAENLGKGAAVDSLTQVEEVPCGTNPPTPTPTPNDPNQKKDPPPGVLQKQCLQTAAQKATACESAKNNAASSCDPDKNDSLKNANVQGRDIISKAGDQQNINLVCQQNTAYQNDVATALQNYSAACGQALASCQSTCADAQSEIAKCQIDGMRTIKDTAQRSSDACASGSDISKKFEEAKTQTANTQNAAKQSAAQCPMSSAGAGGNGPTKQDATKVGGAVSETGLANDTRPTAAPREESAENPAASSANLSHNVYSNLKKSSADDGADGDHHLAGIGASGGGVMAGDEPNTSLPAVPKFSDPKATPSSISNSSRGGSGSWSVSGLMGFLRRPSSEEEANAAKAAGKDKADGDTMPDLRKFLPQMGGNADGYQGIAGLHSPHKDIFEAVQDRYQSVRGSLFPE